MHQMLLPIVFMCQSAPESSRVLLDRPDLGVQVRVFVRRVPTGFHLGLVNTGSSAVHFELALADQETGKEAVPRIHLGIGSKASLRFKTYPGDLRIKDVRVGHSDDGDYVED